MNAGLRARLGVPVNRLGSPRPAQALVVVLLLGVLLSTCTAPDDEFAEQSLFISNIAVVDDGTVYSARDVVVKDGRIAAISPTGETAPAATAKRIDGGGLYLVPGLWDMHVHLTYSPTWQAAMRRHFLAYGVTSVRDTGASAGTLGWLQHVRERVDGPRLFFSGPLLDGPLNIYRGDDAHPALGWALATPAQATHAVARLAQAGVSFIKSYELLDEAVFQSILQAARDHGLPVAAHLPLTTDARVAVQSGVKSFEHLRNFEFACSADATVRLEKRRQFIRNEVAVGQRSGEVIRQALYAEQRMDALAAQAPTQCQHLISDMAQRGTAHTPTLGITTFHKSAPYVDPRWTRALARVPPSERARLEARRQRILVARATATGAAYEAWTFGMVEQLHAAGIPLLAGTDTPTLLQIPGESLHRELELLVRAGLSPAAALNTATVNAAAFFSLDTKLGRVQPGYLADLVILEANPLDDIRHSRRIRAVVSRGRYLERADLDALLD